MKKTAQITARDGKIIFLVLVIIKLICFKAMASEDHSGLVCVSYGLLPKAIQKKKCTHITCSSIDPDGFQYKKLQTIRKGCEIMRKAFPQTYPVITDVNNKTCYCPYNN